MSCSLRPYDPWRTVYRMGETMSAASSENPAGTAAFRLEGLDAVPPEDQAAIGTTCTALATAFIHHDADRLADAYAPDADWV